MLKQTVTCDYKCDTLLLADLGCHVSSGSAINVPPWWKTSISFGWQGLDSIASQNNLTVSHTLCSTLRNLCHLLLYKSWHSLDKGTTMPLYIRMKIHTQRPGDHHIAVWLWSHKSFLAWLQLMTAVHGNFRTMKPWFLLGCNEDCLLLVCLWRLDHNHSSMYNWRFISWQSIG